MHLDGTDSNYTDNFKQDFVVQNKNSQKRPAFLKLGSGINSFRVLPKEHSGLVSVISIIENLKLADKADGYSGLSKEFKSVS